MGTRKLLLGALFGLVGIGAAVYALLSMRAPHRSPEPAGPTAPTEVAAPLPPPPPPARPAPPVRAMPRPIARPPEPSPAPVAPVQAGPVELSPAEQEAVEQSFARYRITARQLMLDHKSGKIHEAEFRAALARAHADTEQDLRDALGEDRAERYLASLPDHPGHGPLDGGASP